LSQHGLDRDSQSQRRQRVSLGSRENLDSVKKLVSTTMSRPKSLDQDREICRDLKFLAFLNRLSRSRPRSAWIFVFSRRDFSIRRDFRPRQCRDFSTNLDNLDASRQSRQKSRRVKVSTENVFDNFNPEVQGSRP
jgi:hypothetical protein